MVFSRFPEVFISKKNDLFQKFGKLPETSIVGQNALIQEIENLKFDFATTHKLYVYYHEINSFHYESKIQMRSFHFSMYQ